MIASFYIQQQKIIWSYMIRPLGFLVQKIGLFVLLIIHLYKILLNKNKERITILAKMLER